MISVVGALQFQNYHGFLFDFCQSDCLAHRACGSVGGYSLQKHKNNCSAFYVTFWLALSVAKADSGYAEEGKKNKIKRIVSQP